VKTPVTWLERSTLRSYKTMRGAPRLNYFELLNIMNHSRCGACAGPVNINRPLVEGCLVEVVQF